MLWEEIRYYGLGTHALVIECPWNTNVNYGLGMDALVSGCSWNTNVTRVWAWMPRETARKGGGCCHGCGMDAQRKRHAWEGPEVRATQASFDGLRREPMFCRLTARRPKQKESLYNKKGVKTN